VLFEEALKALGVHESGTYIDGTFGRGGHSGEILNRLGENGHLMAIDKDPDAVVFGRQLFAGDQRFDIKQGSFSMLSEFVEAEGLVGKVNGVLLDLGVSSPQLDQAERGFSFMSDGPLDMRMDNTSGQTAAEWLAAAETFEIAKVLKDYGDERFAKRIARSIVNAREEQPIETTRQLSELVSAAIPSWEKGKHPATRSFQAIRIHINGELDDLKACLTQAIDILAPGGRLVVISFHSLEDRITKRFIREGARGDDFPPGLPVTADQLNPTLKRIGKPVYPSQEEVDTNPRSRSAVLRIAEKIA